MRGDGGNQKANRRAGRVVKEARASWRGAPFFLWIANGDRDRACKTIFKSPLIMNSLMNAPPSLRSAQPTILTLAYLRGSFSSRDSLCTRMSTSGWTMDFRGREPPFCFLGCVILALFLFWNPFQKEVNFHETSYRLVGLRGEGIFLDFRVLLKWKFINRGGRVYTRIFSIKLIPIDRRQQSSFDTLYILKAYSQ